MDTGASTIMWVGSWPTFLSVCITAGLAACRPGCSSSSERAGEEKWQLLEHAHYPPSASDKRDWHLYRQLCIRLAMFAFGWLCSELSYQTYKESMLLRCPSITTLAFLSSASMTLIALQVKLTYHQSTNCGADNTALSTNVSSNRY
jgi:hypothetical protein